MDYSNQVVTKTLEATKLIQTKLSHNEAINQTDWILDHYNQVRKDLILNHAFREQNKEEEI